MFALTAFSIPKGVVAAAQREKVGEKIKKIILNVHARAY
jgi:hypothetical protein